MNKKGLIEWFPIFMLVVAGLTFIFGAVMIQANLQAQEESCEKLGMEYKSMFDSDVCIDENNHAHFVDIECEGFIFIECTPTIIDVGNIRVG